MPMIAAPVASTERGVASTPLHTLWICPDLRGCCPPSPVTYQTVAYLLEQECTLWPLGHAMKVYAVGYNLTINLQVLMAETGLLLCNSTVPSKVDCQFCLGPLDTYVIYNKHLIIKTNLNKCTKRRGQSQI